MTNTRKCCYLGTNGKKKFVQVHSTAHCIFFAVHSWRSPGIWEPVNTGADRACF